MTNSNLRTLFCGSDEHLVGSAYVDGDLFVRQRVELSWAHHYGMGMAWEKEKAKTLQNALAFQKI